MASVKCRDGAIDDLNNSASAMVKMKIQAIDWKDDVIALCEDLPCGY